LSELNAAAENTFGFLGTYAAPIGVAARRGWKALCSHVGPDGRLGYVQPIGGSPQRTNREMTEVYGVGAFLMAASEIVRM